MRLGSTLLCRIVRSSSSRHRPWQVAMAVTAGALLGLLPKSILLFALVGLICFVIPAHLPMLALTAILISFASPLLHPTLGRIGLWSLTHPNLSVYWMRLDSMPLVPWLGIHNTVVNGSLIAWLVASVPVYISSLMVSKMLMHSEVPDEVADILLSTEESPKASSVDEAQEIRPLLGLRAPGAVRPRIEPPIVIWDDINHNQSYFNNFAEAEFAAGTEATPSDQVIRRAAEMAVWAEELISEELLMDNPAESRNPVESYNPIDSHSVEVGVDDEERWLIETTLEMVRIAERAVTDQAAMKAKQSGDALDVASTDSLSKESFEIQTVQSQNAIVAAGDEGALPAASIRREQMPHDERSSHLGHTHAGLTGSSTSGVVNRPREEALHYLLRHLKGVQEKAQKQ